MKFLVLALSIFTSTLAFAQGVDYDQTRQEVIGLLDGKLATTGGKLACTDMNNAAMYMIHPSNNPNMVAFNYVDAASNTTQIPMWQFLYFGTSADIEMTVNPISATEETIAVTSQFRGTHETPLVDAQGNVSYQAGDREKTLTLDVAIDANGGLTLNSVSAQMVTYFQQANGQGLAGQITYVFNCP